MCRNWLTARISKGGVVCRLSCMHLRRHVPVNHQARERWGVVPSVMYTPPTSCTGLSSSSRKVGSCAVCQACFFEVSRRSTVRISIGVVVCRLSSKHLRRQALVYHQDREKWGSMPSVINARVAPWLNHSQDCLRWGGVPSASIQLINELLSTCQI